MDETKPEFNNGFITALALFYAHRFKRIKGAGGEDYRIHAGSDHLLRIEIPDSLPDELKNELTEFVRKVISRRYDFTISEGEIEFLFEWCIDILIKLDKAIFGLDVVVNYE
jgi:hypothetical protein